LAAVLAVTLVADVGGGDQNPSSWRLVVRDAHGVTLAQADLADGRFALRYRNSIYGSRAEERFSIADDGRIHLVGLAAEEAAVLGEYYGARGPRPAIDAAELRWEAEPAYPVALDRLLLAATDLGERSLVADGHEPIALWRLVADTSPALSLGAERVR
jgi:hypothetical protein